MSDKNIVTVSVEFLHHTELAVLVKDGDSEIWLPKSQIEDEEDWDILEREDPIEVSIPEWLAWDKGLI